jgi:hypothetical protein
MWRNVDWRCACGTIHEDLVEVPYGSPLPKSHFTSCPRCRKVTRCTRVLSAPAQYLGEKPLSPRVHGGSFDTMGKRRLPSLPEFTGETGQDFVDHVHTREYQVTKKRRAAIRAENALKRRRAAAGVSFRHNPVPGDPKWT